VDQMKTYRSSVVEHAAYAGITTMMALGLTRPVGWVSRHQAALRSMLRLE
jgi:hypothetical protein